MEASYQQFADVEDSEETPQDSGVMIHIVPHSEKASRWNHIEDLDSFFTQVYQYHQKHGFTCMVVQEVLSLSQFIFILIFSMFLLKCVDYPVLFRDKVTNNTANHKISLSEAVLSSEQCRENMGAISWTVVVIAIMVWLFHAIKVVCHLFQYWDVKLFFNTALKISDNDLENVTWHEVQKRVLEVQKEQQMCIHKKDLSQLDIYHRILRFKNYMVAMVNKSLIPVRLQIPFLGEKIYMSHGLKTNIEILLFRGPWAPFKNNWHLKEEYKKGNRRHELSQRLSNLILFFAFLNFVFSPLIFVWQIAVAFFSYAELVKREPGTLGARCWSVYSRLYLRHFNELDHELHARLTRAYEPAAKYMTSFTSPLMTIIAKNVQFVAGSLLSVLLALTVYDEDVLTVEHVLTIITVFSAIFAIFRSLIPNENVVHCPETLMTSVLAHVHYLPYSWRGQAHTTKVHQEFSQIFQYKAMFLLDELLSPIITPVILCFHLRSKALDIVDFFRNFTVEVVGVGDVCSFAQMDVRRHGNPTWQSNVVPSEPLPNQYTQAEDGKTELSLVHFTHTNPDWQLPEDAHNFVSAVRTKAREEISNLPQINAPLPDGYMSIFGMGLSSVPRPNMPGPSYVENLSTTIASPTMTFGGTGISRAEGPLQFDLRSRYISPHQGVPIQNPSLGASVFGSGVDAINRFECTATDMSVSALFLHELHHRQVKRRGYHESGEPMPVWQRAPPGTSGIGGERTPLLHTPSHPS